MVREIFLSMGHGPVLESFTYVTVVKWSYITFCSSFFCPISLTVFTTFLSGFMLVSLQESMMYKHDESIIILMPLLFRACVVKKIHHKKLIAISLKYFTGGRNMTFSSYSYVSLEKVEFANKGGATNIQ